MTVLTVILVVLLLVMASKLDTANKRLAFKRAEVIKLRADFDAVDKCCQEAERRMHIAEERVEALTGEKA